MNITRWSPFGDLDDFFRSYNRGLTRHVPNEGMLSTDWSPSVDITENDTEFLIKAELPEVKKEDIKVDVHNGVLSLSGERRSETKDEKEHRVERFYGRFSRSFTLPETVAEEQITAENKEGMLYVHLPKAREAKPQRIDVAVQ